MNLSRKVSAFLATLGMIFAGLVAGFFNPASAESTTITSFTNNSTITVEAASDVDISGRTLKAIPLGYYTSAVTKSDSTDTLDNVTVGKVDDTRDTAIRDALVAAGLVTQSGTSPNSTYTAAVTCQTSLDTNNYAAWVAGCLNDSTASPWAGKLRNFVTALDTALGESVSGAALTAVANEKNKQQVTGLQPGLYMILDRTATDNNASRSIPMVVGTGVKNGENTYYSKLGDNSQVLGTVEYKATDKPTFDKNILEDTKNTADNYTDDDKKKKNQVSIGDVVTFELSVTVPPTAGYSAYWLELGDTLSKGLTFKEFKTVTSGTTNLVEDTDYKVIGTGTNGAVAADAMGETKFRILLAPKPNGTDSDILQSEDMKTKFAAGSVVKVIYTATLNKDAVIEQTGNPNELTLTYSNNPNDTTKKKTTPPVETRTYTGQFSICKKDAGNKALPGAQFSLWNGTDTDAEAMKFVGSAGSYRPLSETDAAGTTSVTALDTNTDGCLKFTGLKTGDYTLKETKAPEGFSSTFLPTVTFTLTVTEPSTAAGNAYSAISEKSGDTNNLVELGSEKTVTVTPAVAAGEGTEAVDAVTTTVKDSAIVHNVRNIGELPKTGAAWLAIFAGGTVLFAAMGAALMFMGRRRTNS